MVIYRKLEEFESIGSSVLTIGTFDGVHEGHQRIISQTVEYAKSVGLQSALITFDPHPQHILHSNNQSKKELITTIEKKMSLIEEIGIDIVLILPFDNHIASMTAERFFNDVIIEKFNPRKIIIGHDHHFGHNREGTSKFLSKKSKSHSFELEIFQPVCYGDDVISSTAIRKAVYNRNFSLAERYLGRPFEITGIVVHGIGRGASLNFPTANIHISGKDILKPPIGVYCVKILIGNRCFHGACNIGYRPTFEERLTEPIIEVNIFDDSIKNLYGEVISLQFIKFVRNEIKFEASDQLIKQLINDKEFCLNLHEK